MKGNYWFWIFKDFVGCIYLFASGIALCCLPIPQFIHVEFAGSRLSGAALMFLALSVILTHLNWFNMRRDIIPFLAEQARWELEVEYQPVPEQVTMEVKFDEEEYSLDSTVSTRQKVPSEESLDGFEEIVIVRRTFKHPPRRPATSEHEETSIWKRLEGIEDENYDEFWLAEDEQSIADGFCLPDVWSTVEDRYEEIQMEVIEEAESDASSREKKVVSDPQKNIHRKPAPPVTEPETSMTRRSETRKTAVEEKQSQMVSRSVDACLETAEKEVFADKQVKQSASGLPAIPDITSTGVSATHANEVGVDAAVQVSIPDITSTGVSATHANEVGVNHGTQSKPHDALAKGSATEPHIVPNRIDTGVNPDETVQDSLTDNKRIGTTESIPVTVPVKSPAVNNDLKPRHSQSVRSHDNSGVQDTRLPSENAEIKSGGKPEIMTKPDKEVLHQELTLKIRSRQEQQPRDQDTTVAARSVKQDRTTTGEKGPLLERLLIEEQAMTIQMQDKVSPEVSTQDSREQVGKTAKAQRAQGTESAATHISSHGGSTQDSAGQVETTAEVQQGHNAIDASNDATSNIKSEDDSSAFETPQSSPDKPCLAVRRANSQYSTAKDMIETGQMDAERSSNSARMPDGQETSPGSSSWVQSVVEKLSSEPGSELNVKMTNREEEITEEKITLYDDDTNEVKTEEKVKSGVTEEQVKIDKTF